MSKTEQIIALATMEGKELSIVKIAEIVKTTGKSVSSVISKQKAKDIKEGTTHAWTYAGGNYSTFGSNGVSSLDDLMKLVEEAA